MFNIISGKCMTVVYQIAAISLVLSQLLIASEWSKAAVPFFIMLLLTAPYMFEIWRTRDFTQANIISGVIVLWAFIINLLVYKVNTDATIFYMINIVISFAGQTIHSLAYSIVFKRSKAKSELRRYRVGEDVLSFYHFVTTSILTIIIFNITKIPKNIMWMCIGVYLLLYFLRKLTIFVIDAVLK